MCCVRPRRFEKTFGPKKLRPTVGTFPIAEVSNGHTFFIQKLHEIVGVAPVAVSPDDSRRDRIRLCRDDPPTAGRASQVHTTYQYGDDSGYAYGKRARLRDFGLWAIDDDSYYAGGRYLQLVSAPARQLSPMKVSNLVEYRRSLSATEHPRATYSPHLPDAVIELAPRA